MKKIFLSGTFKEKEEEASLKEIYDLLSREYEVWWALLKLGRGYGSEDEKRIKQVVEIEKENIRNSNALVACLKEPTPGTLMEVLYAFENKIPVIGYWMAKNPRLVDSPWIKYHISKAVDRKEDLISVLHNL
jgi:nucleoside 2-deoxyribosyltransferase